MKYDVTFTASITDKDGYSRIHWFTTHTVEIDHLSNLVPMMTAVEKVVEQWREAQSHE